jgi:hypothetical protein
MIEEIATANDAFPGYLLPDSGSQSRLPILLNKITEISK